MSDYLFFSLALAVSCLTAVFFTIHFLFDGVFNVKNNNFENFHIAMWWFLVNAVLWGFYFHLNQTT